MIAKTSTGDAYLSRPENIRRGMVFEHKGRRLTIECVASLIGATAWSCNENALVLCEAALVDCHFLGMDPTVADRADCERFGIADGVDAAAHGFARTRDGFVVDLWRAAPRQGWVIGNDGSAGRLTLTQRQPTALAEGQRFYGLDARYASPEDVARLCCGAESREDPTAWNYHRCTLAIGPHGQHEDIAQGTKWPAVNESDRDLSECRARGWWAILPGSCTGWRPVPPGTAGASEDLNRLSYFRQTGADGYYLSAHFNPWIYDAEEATKWMAALRVRDVVMPCIVTHRLAHQRRGGSESMTATREVNVRVALVVRADEIAAAFEAGEDCTLFESEAQTQMLARRWTFSMRPDVRNGVDLSLELVEKVDAPEHPAVVELRRIEWSGDSHWGAGRPMRCPSCRGAYPEHAEACRLLAAISPQSGADHGAKGQGQ